MDRLIARMREICLKQKLFVDRQVRTSLLAALPMLGWLALRDCTYLPAQHFKTVSVACTARCRGWVDVR